MMFLNEQSFLMEIFML